MLIFKIYLFLNIYLLIFFLPIIIIWCIIPHKSLEEGLHNWFYESEGDI